VSETPKKRGLGRGLSALMADVTVAAAEGPALKRPDMHVPIDKVFPNPVQPRRNFSEEALNELSESIREKGVLQPLIVRPRPGREGEFEIVAGERRWRASQIANQHSIPVIVREFDDLEVLEIAIIENVQRADLNAIEEAVGYRQLMDKFGHTQERLSDAIGKSRSHIANLLRLLTLPEEVVTHVREGRLSAGHARALVASENPIQTAHKVIKDGLSVRETERLVKKPVTNIFNEGGKKGRTLGSKDADTRALEADLSAALKMQVEIAHSSGREDGSILVRYKSLDELDELCRLLSASR